MATIFVPNELYCPITGELMKDPVTEPDGHTYEREAIMKWLSKNNTSPMTRKPLSEKELYANIPFKKTIDSMREKLSEDQLKIDTQLLDKDLEHFTDKLSEINIGYFEKDNLLFIKIDMPKVDIRQPVDVCLCIDVSGSMGVDAPIKGGDGSSVSHGISVLSLTVTAAKTILKTLNEKDNISIITYTDKSDVLFTDCPCTIQNKQTIEIELDNLKPLSTTNIWDGLKTSLDCLRLNSPPNKLKVIKLLTDGIPSYEPNRGHEYELEKYFKTHDFKCMINCYGFGYSLKSELLDNISRLSGGDGYSFIPDSSLLGNIFIHGISNFFTTALYNIPLAITYENGVTRNININSLKYGQSKNMVLTNILLIQTISLNINGKDIKANMIELDEKYYEQLYRYKTYNMLDSCINLKKFNKDNYKTDLENLILEITFNKEVEDNEYIKNILFDLEGQVKEALNMTSQGEREDWFSKWGIHYLRSLKSAYENEICNNFKDKGVSNFTGELFEKLRDEVSDIFDDMPPPKKIVNNYGRPCGSYIAYGSGSGSLSNNLPQLVSMASYNTSGGGCCAKGCRIRMEDNSLKNVEDLRKGDKVITVNIKNDIQIIESGIIECVVVTKCNGLENMVTLGNLKITPYHPIIDFGQGDWIYPKDIYKAREIECEEMYTFVLDNRQSVLIEDYIFATYGHGLDENEVILHDYFGTEKVIDDLKSFNSYKNGHMYLTKNMFRSNEDGVYSISYAYDYLKIITKMYYANL